MPQKPASSSIGSRNRIAGRQTLLSNNIQHFSGFKKAFEYLLQRLKLSVIANEWILGGGLEKYCLQMSQSKRLHPGGGRGENDVRVMAGAGTKPTRLSCLRGNDRPQPVQALCRICACHVSCLRLRLSGSEGFAAHCRCPPLAYWRACSFSVKTGRSCFRSATAKTSATSPMGASRSVLIATTNSDFFMPARCWIAPEIPQAT